MSNANLNRELPEWLARAFKKVDWPIPSYLQIGFLSSLAKAIEDAEPDLRSEIMRQHLARAYNPEYLVSMLLERFNKIALVQDFQPQIDEAMKAYFSGYKYVAAR